MVDFIVTVLLWLGGGPVLYVLVALLVIVRTLWTPLRGLSNRSTRYRQRASRIEAIGVLEALVAGGDAGLPAAANHVRRLLTTGGTLLEAAALCERGRVLSARDPDRAGAYTTIDATMRELLGERWPTPSTPSSPVSV